MRKYIVYFSIIILMLFLGCTQSQTSLENNAQEIQNQAQEPSDQAAEVNLPIQVAQANANFSGITHKMQLENALWKIPIEYKLTSEEGMDEYRLNITLKAVDEAIAELENLTNKSLVFQKSDADYGLLVEINTSLKHIDPKALGISSIQSYIARENYNEVTKAWIALTPTYPCAAKIEAMHELLHILGFGHSSETNSIMYTYGAVCTSKVTDSVRQTLNALYPAL